MSVEERKGLPAGWVFCKLGEVITLINGRAYSQHEMMSSGVPILRIQNLNGGKNWFYSDMNLPEDKYCHDGDLLYAWSATFGPYWWKGQRAIFHYHIWNIRTSNLFNKKFAYYELLRITDEVKSASHGVAMPHMTKSGMEAWEIMLPPLPEQIRIADKLDALFARVEAGRERLERVPKLVKAFRQAVLSAAVSGELTREWRGGGDAAWEEVQLRACASDFSYGSAAKSSKSGTTPVLRMGNIQSGLLVWDDLVYTSERVEIKKYTLKSGDVLFNRTNSPELVGKTAVYRGERPAIYAGYLIRVRCNDTLIPDYLNHCLNSKQGRDYCWEVKTDGVSQSNINAQKLRDFSFALPPLPEQAEIVRRVEALFTLADRLEARYQSALASFDRLTPALLAKAFRGELVPQDPDDEPASVLLERIRAQRAAEGSKPKRGRGAAPSSAEEPKRQGRLPKAQAEAEEQAPSAEAAAQTSDLQPPRRRGRPLKVRPEAQAQAPAEIPEASSYEDAVRKLEALKLERAGGTRQVSLFELETTEG